MRLEDQVDMLAKLSAVSFVLRAIASELATTAANPVKEVRHIGLMGEELASNI